MQSIKLTVVLTPVTLAALGLMISSCKDHDHGHSEHDSSRGEDGQTAQPLPTEGASVKIFAPAKDQIFTGNQVLIQFELDKGQQGHHVHAYVDGALMGMFEGTKGTLTGVKPGKHELELRVVTADHNIELDALNRVDFTVK